VARGLRTAGFDPVFEVPMADGGEGTLDALLAARGGSRRTARVTGPLGEPVDAEYGLLPDGTGVVEMAQASGLALAVPKDPLRASTRGTGELIAAVRRGGARRILVGLGGSATTDGGLAAVEALGWSLGGIEVSVACDVATPFLEAARRFGPQKGASYAQVELLSRRLASVAEVYLRRTGVDVTALEGGGAAGGLAGGLAAIGARLEPTTSISSSRVKAGPTPRASTARSSVGCSNGPPTWASRAVPSSRARSPMMRTRSSACSARRGTRSSIASGSRARHSRGRRCSSRRLPSKPAAAPWPDPRG
jgi:glycerate kinase